MRTLILVLALTTAGGGIQAQLKHPPPGEPPKIVLLPAPIGLTPGALGSVWETELWIYNSHTFPLELTPGPCRLNLPDHCRVRIEPGQSRRLEAPEGDPAGSFSTLAVISNHEKLHFNLRSRDRTRASESAGTEIAVVRDWRTHTVQLLNVPIDSRFRSNLRIFLHPFGSGRQTFRVRGFAMDGGTAFYQREVELQIPVLPAIYTGFLAPSQMITDLFAAAPPGVLAVRVEVAPLGTDSFWAYVSVTNNETGHFTTITPQ